MITNTQHNKTTLERALESAVLNEDRIIKELRQLFDELNNMGRGEITQVLMRTSEVDPEAGWMDYNRIQYSPESKRVTVERGPIAEFNSGVGTIWFLPVFENELAEDGGVSAESFILDIYEKLVNNMNKLVKLSLDKFGTYDFAKRLINDSQITIDEFPEPDIPFTFWMEELVISHMGPYKNMFINQEFIRKIIDKISPASSKDGFLLLVIAKNVTGNLRSAAIDRINESYLFLKRVTEENLNDIYYETARRVMVDNKFS